MTSTLEPHPVVRSPLRRRIGVGLVVGMCLLVPGLIGYQVGSDDGGSVAAFTDGTSITLPSPVAQPGATGSASGGQPGDWGTGGSGRSGAADTQSGGSGRLDLDRLGDAVDDVVVNVYASVEGGGRTSGTGIVISDDGLVLTNNHVIAGAVELDVEFGQTGRTRAAKVLGYSIVDDVALIRVQNVSGLAVAKLGTSATLRIGDPIVVLGNAGGRGGRPKVVAGRISALEREITASDSDGSNAQSLEGLIEVAADIESGDSGGPVVDRRGRVVGMTAAASVERGWRMPAAPSGQGYAIPIEDALAIVDKITSGEGGADIRVGARRAVLGVQVQSALTGSRVPGGPGTTASGAEILAIDPGSGADRAGLTRGDVVVAIGGRRVATSDDLIRALVRYAPGESVEVTVRNARGDTRRVAVDLGSGPPA